MPPTVKVATWNLFHGQTSPPDRRDHFRDFARVLAAADWDACALQEVPQWWPGALGRSCAASVRVARGSRVRSLAPAAQRGIARRSPGLLGTAGAGVNALLLRPAAGVIATHRRERLRSLPQGRSVHAVRLWHPGLGAWWFANAHAHNQPESAAASDTLRALEVVRGWAAGEPVALAGDLNLGDAAATRIAAQAGFHVLGGQRVDHVLARGMARTAGVTCQRAGTGAGRTLSDHRLVTVELTVASPGPPATGEATRR